MASMLPSQNRTAREGKSREGRGSEQTVSLEGRWAWVGSEAEKAAEEGQGGPARTHDQVPQARGDPERF